MESVQGRTWGEERRHVSPDANRVMKVPEAADYLQLTAEALYVAVARGQLPVTRIGRRLRFRKSDLDEFLLARTNGPLEPQDPSGWRNRP
jgi:excisionase family DNA binding protein